MPAVDHAGSGLDGGFRMRIKDFNADSESDAEMPDAVSPASIRDFLPGPPDSVRDRVNLFRSVSHEHVDLFSKATEVQEMPRPAVSDEGPKRFRPPPFLGEVMFTASELRRLHGWPEPTVRTATPATDSSNGNASN